MRFAAHFCIVGPSSNPAGLVKGGDARTLFQALYTAAQAGASPPTRFLSRFDKSATNIKESELWITIGQVPWAMPYSNWYHVFLDFPIQALEAAAILGQYTLTDWGTWLSAGPSVTKSLTLFRKGEDDAADVLLNPCHALASTRIGAADQAVARDFITWLTSTSGQAVIAGFEKNGQALYSPAPSEEPSTA
jgi:ABC-type tungstate transport system permease subunit